MPRRIMMEFVDLVGFWKEKVGEILLTGHCLTDTANQDFG